MYGHVPGLETVKDACGRTPSGGTLLPNGYLEWLVDTCSWAKTMRRALYPKGALAAGRRNSRGLPHRKEEWKLQGKAKQQHWKKFRAVRANEKGRRKEKTAPQKGGNITPGVRPF